MVNYEVCLKLQYSLYFVAGVLKNENLKKFVMELFSVLEQQLKRICNGLGLVVFQFSYQPNRARE